MKTNKFQIVALVILSLTVTSCSTTLKVRTTIAQKPLPKLNTIALVSAQITPIVQPLIPLIDAAAFNKKTNSIADQIMDEQKKRVDKLRQTLAENMGKYFQSTIRYGAELQADKNFAVISSKYNFVNNLRIESNNFPYIMIASGDINPFPVDKAKIVQFFKDPINYKQIAKDICTTLGTDAIAVSYTNLFVINAAAFGMSGGLSLNSILYLFDKDGDMIASGSYYSNPTMINGKEINDYRMKLDEYNAVCDLIVSKTATDYITPKK
jgi:hypothetical protein